MRRQRHHLGTFLQHNKPFNYIQEHMLGIHHDLTSCFPQYCTSREGLTPRHNHFSFIDFSLDTFPCFENPITTTLHTFNPTPSRPLKHFHQLSSRLCEPPSPPLVFNTMKLDMHHHGLWIIKMNTNTLFSSPLILSALVPSLSTSFTTAFVVVAMAACFRRYHNLKGL